MISLFSQVVLAGAHVSAQIQKLNSFIKTCQLEGEAYILTVTIYDVDLHFFPLKVFRNSPDA